MVTASPLCGDARDVVVVGGGPAGLAAAIGAAGIGASVLVVERRDFPPDKVCGEGLLPPAVRALERLGVLDEIAPSARHAMTGIRFVQEDGSSAAVLLPVPGLGVRRTALVEAMARRAIRLGATIVDGTPVVRCDRDRTGAVVRTARGDVRARLVVAADGLHSPLRRAAGLDAPAAARRRFAVRRHFAVRPWTDHVEVYVDERGEAVVTPIAAGAVNVNMVWEAGGEPPGFEGLRDRFPALHARLAGAVPLSTLRGAGPMAQLALRRTCERMVLLGDAAGFVDSIAADGLSLAFASALVLRAMLPAILARDVTPESLAGYERAARRLFRSYRHVTGTMLWIARHPRVRRRLIRGIGRHRGIAEMMMQGALRLMPA